MAKREIVPEPANPNLYEDIVSYSNIGKEQTSSQGIVHRNFIPPFLRNLMTEKDEHTTLPQRNNISTPSVFSTIAHSPYIWFLAGGSFLFAGAAMKPGYPVTVLAALGAAAFVLGVHYFVDNHEKERGE